MVKTHKVFTTGSLGVKSLDITGLRIYGHKGIVHVAEVDGVSSLGEYRNIPDSLVQHGKSGQGLGVLHHVKHSLAIVAYVVLTKLAAKLEGLR